MQAGACALAAAAFVPALLSAAGGPFPRFDGEEAMAHVRAQVAFGPRIPGTEGHARTRAWLESELERRGASVKRRTFSGTNSLTGSAFTGTNLIASFRPELTERVLFGAHWDTRAKADLDPDPGRRSEPVPGANDGGSGVAVLLVLAGILGDREPPFGVDLVFFDGEDQGSPGSAAGYCIGSRSFAASLSVTGYAPRYAVVVDMVGHARASISRDRLSLDCCADRVERIWRIGRRVAPGIFDESATISLYDDHAPLVDAGVPTVLLAGYGFPEWHTTGDLPEICSARTLAAVGSVLVELVYGADENP